MKHARLIVLAAAVAAGSLASLPVAAQQEPLPDISGAWKFKTDPLPNKGCVISGNITFKRIGRTNSYSCRFVSQEDCDRPGGPTFTRVQQSCSVTHSDGAFEITSTIDRIVDAGPADFKAAMMASENYAPDNFKVRPNKGELTGDFHSVRQANVRFWRDTDLVG